MTITSSHIAIFQSILHQNEGVQRVLTPTRVFRGFSRNYGGMGGVTKKIFFYSIERKILHRIHQKNNFEFPGKCEFWFSTPQMLNFNFQLPSRGKGQLIFQSKLMLTSFEFLHSILDTTMMGHPLHLGFDIIVAISHLWLINIHGYGRGEIKHKSSCT